MPYVEFQFRMQAAAVRQLALIGAMRAADGGAPEYLKGLQQVACVPAPKPVFALVQSDD